MSLQFIRLPTQELESIQKRAIHIIFHFTRGMPYSYMLAATNLTSLSSRRDDLSRSFFFSVLPILHPVYTLPFPHPDLMQLHLGLDHTKFTQDRPPVEAILFPRAVWPFSLPEQDCQQLISISLILHILAIPIINSYYNFFIITFILLGLPLYILSSFIQFSSVQYL